MEKKDQTGTTHAVAAASAESAQAANARLPCAGLLLWVWGLGSCLENEAERDPGPADNWSVAVGAGSGFGSLASSGCMAVTSSSCMAGGTTLASSLSCSSLSCLSLSCSATRSNSLNV